MPIATGPKDNLKKWINPQQLAAFRLLARSEEAQAYWEIKKEIRETLDNMPKTYDTEDQSDPMVHLHYFYGSWDWYLTEKDLNEEQNQAFGLVVSPYCPNGELGYISIPEILKVNAELDFYFTKKPISAF